MAAWFEICGLNRLLYVEARAERVRILHFYSASHEKLYVIMCNVTADTSVKPNVRRPLCTDSDTTGRSTVYSCTSIYAYGLRYSLA